MPEGAALQAQADGTINSSRPEHTKRTQGNAEQRKATHAGQAEPTQQIQHQQTENRTPRIPSATRWRLETTHRRPKTETYTQTASRSPLETTNRGLPQPRRPSQPNLPRTTLAWMLRSYQPLSNSVLPRPSVSLSLSQSVSQSAPEAYKQRPSTSRHHSVWSALFVTRSTRYDVVQSHPDTAVQL